jgi:transcription initiation factor TFIIE subunit alpha
VGSTARIPDEVRSLVRQDAGEEAVDVLEALAERGRSTDTDLAESLGLRTSQIRRALYSMYERRFADYAENRDPATGWLTFVWEYTPAQAERALSEAKRKAAVELRAEIDRERTAEFFACPQGHVRMEFASAMDVSFACPECGSPFEPVDKEARIAELTAQLESLERGEA